MGSPNHSTFIYIAIAKINETRIEAFLLCVIAAQSDDESTKEKTKMDNKSFSLSDKRVANKYCQVPLLAHGYFGYNNSPYTFMAC